MPVTDPGDITDCGRASPDLRARIGELGQAIDRHRKQRQALFPDLTVTGMYNVLESLRQGQKLLSKDREIHEQGLVSLLGELHDELDALVFEAYGWSDLTPALVGKPGGTTPYRTPSREQQDAEEELLTRLVRLKRRARPGRSPRARALAATRVPEPRR